MRRSAYGLVAVLATLVLRAPQLAAQVNDVARLSFGFSVGKIGSTSLWDVPAQPILSGTVGNPGDVFDVRRDFRNGIAVGVDGTYFPGPLVGFTVGMRYLGTVHRDDCSVTQDGGDQTLAAACAIIPSNRGGSSATLHAGITARTSPRHFVQLYGKLLGGLAFTPSNPAAMSAVVDGIDLLTVYHNNEDWGSVHPSWAWGAGISTAASSGYTVHIEFQDVSMPSRVITGPNARQALTALTKSTTLYFPVVMIGMDIVMSRSRGKRY